MKKTIRKTAVPASRKSSKVSMPIRPVKFTKKITGKKVGD